MRTRIETIREVLDELVQAQTTTALCLARTQELVASEDASLGTRPMAPCLIATEDETYTCNHKVNVVPPIQEHFIIMKAMESGVSEERIARALAVDEGWSRGSGSTSQREGPRSEGGACGHG